LPIPRCPNLKSTNLARDGEKSPDNCEKIQIPSLFASRIYLA
jgi:hypothetical protein